MKRGDYMFCSRGEVLERARICDVHLFEATDGSSDRKNPISCRVMDPSRAVRKFTRSGSSDLHKTYEPRSFAQLQATVHYLLRDIWWQSTKQSCDRGNQHLLGKSGSDLGLAYTFVMDRLQAVRQDIISLNMFVSNPHGVVKLLRDIIIFYVNSMHLITSGYGALVASPSPTAGDRKPRETPMYGKSYSSAPFQSVGKNASSAPLISISSWFDLHSHESALSSSLTTNLSFCRQLPVKHRDAVCGFDVAAHYEEFSACAMLLSTARQLRNIFQHVHSSTSSSSHNIKAIGAMRLMCVQQPTLGSASVDTLIELDQYRSKSFDDKFANTELRSMSTLGLSTSVHSALRCVSCVRRSNPEGAVRAFSAYAGISSTTTAGTIKLKMDAFSGRTEAETFDRAQRLLMAALLHHMLPELRQCRLMLCDLADKKDGIIDLVSLGRRLWLSPLSKNVSGFVKFRADMMDICEGLGVPVKSAGSPGDEDIATLKASPSNSSKHSSMGQDSAQTNSDISLRNRSTLMGFGGVHLPPSEIASCTAKDVDRGIGSGVARLSSCHHVQVRADLELFQTASFDWEERADVETESTDCAHSDPHFVDIGAPNTLAILQSSQTHDVSNEVKCLGGCPLLKACDVITVLRDLLYHANADDWFGYPGP